MDLSKINILSSPENQESSDKRPEEKRLFSEIKKQNKEAFIKAYDLYVDDIYRFIFFKVSDAEEAQDLTSTVFLKTWNHIQENDLKDFKTLRALIYTVARNSVIDYYRKNFKYNNVAIDDADENIQIVDKQENISKKAEVDSDYELVIENLKKIKSEHREVIVLHYINELTIAEIAKVIDKSKGNVRVILSRGLKSLRDEMEKEKLN